MDAILIKLIKGETPSDDDVAEELYEICSRVHSGCDDGCPVFRVNDHRVPRRRAGQECSCFKNGRKMLEMLQVAHMDGRL